VCVCVSKCKRTLKFIWPKADCGAGSEGFKSTRLLKLAAAKE
jgi:hypothetical protein